VTQPEAGAGQLLVATNVVPGPGGRPVVVLLLQNGPLATQLQVDWERADDLGAFIAAKLKEAHVQARRLNTGLITPDMGPLPGLPPGGVNGVGFHGPGPGHPG
jgi:hypothetical protein